MLYCFIGTSNISFRYLNFFREWWKFSCGLKCEFGDNLQTRKTLLTNLFRCCSLIAVLVMFRNSLFVKLNIWCGPHVLKRHCGLPKQVHLFWKLCELQYMTPLRVPLGFSTISARLQSLSGSLSRWPTACSGLFCEAFFFLFFCFLFCFVFSLVKHLSSPNNISTEMWDVEGGTGHSNPKFAGCETWYLLAQLSGLL